MEAALFNTICITYQNLADTFYNFTRHYSNPYFVYDKDNYVVRDEKLEFLKQFENLNFGLFFTDEHKAPFPNHQYFDTPCVVVEEKFVKIHWDFALVLFNYLVDIFQIELEAFLDLLKVGSVLENRFGFISNDEDKFVFDNSFDKKMMEYFHQNLQNFAMIKHLLINSNSTILYLDDYDNVVINKRIIKNILDSKKKYDFSKYEIK